MKHFIILLLCAISGCMDIGWRIDKTNGQRVFYRSNWNNDNLGITTVEYLDSNNNVYSRNAKISDLVSESEYKSAKADELEFERLKKKLGKE